MLQGGAAYRLPLPTIMLDPSSSRSSPAHASSLEAIAELGAAADTLFRTGLLAQSERLAIEQLDAIVARRAADPTAALGAADAAVDAAYQTLRTSRAPLSWDDDATFSASHSRALAGAIKAGALWLQARGGKAPAPHARRLVLALGGLAIASAALLLLVPRAITLKASARYTDEFDVSNVVDGSLTSEWLLPDAQAGWIELRFRGTRALHTIKLVNAVNRHYRDRATRGFRIDVLRGDQNLGTYKGEFPPVGVGERSLSFPITASAVDRVLVTIESWHGYGAGIAEIQFD